MSTDLSGDVTSVRSSFAFVIDDECYGRSYNSHSDSLNTNEASGAFLKVTECSGKALAPIHHKE